MSWIITYPPEYRLNLSEGGSSSNTSRYFITFSSMDGGRALASEDVQLLAGDEIIIESQIYDSPNVSGMTWLISGNTNADTYLSIVSQTSLQAANVNSINVNGVESVYDGSYWPVGANQTNLRTITAKVASGGVVRNVGASWGGAGSPDCIIARVAIKRAGQIIHDWDFNVDSSTDLITDKAGSNITFSLINVLPGMRVKYTWNDAKQAWVTGNLWTFAQGILDGTGTSWWPPVARINIGNGSYELNLTAVNTVGEWRLAFPSGNTGFSSIGSTGGDVQFSRTGTSPAGGISLWDVTGGTTAGSLSVDIRKIVSYA